MKSTNKFILLFSSLFFIGCGQNTDTPLTHLVSSIDINVTTLQIHSTDAAVKLGATVTFDDNTSADITNNVRWYNSDYNATSMLGGEISGGPENGGESNISIEYEHLSDSITVKVHTLDFNSTQILANSDVNATGTYIFTAYGDFDNGDTNITLVRNLYWSANNGAIITVEDGIAEIEIINTGETNISVRFFDDNTSDRNVSYTID